jgi:hypothetical protein
VESKFDLSPFKKVAEHHKRQPRVSRKKRVLEKSRHYHKLPTYLSSLMRSTIAVTVADSDHSMYRMMLEHFNCLCRLSNIFQNNSRNLVGKSVGRWSCLPSPAASPTGPSKLNASYELLIGCRVSLQLTLMLNQLQLQLTLRTLNNGPQS